MKRLLESNRANTNTDSTHAKIADLVKVQHE